MGLKSINVSQPQFSHWVTQRRQELCLSPAEFRQKLDGKLSDRTLKYLEDGKRETFSEYTLSVLAQGLGLSYPDLLHQIEELKFNHQQRGGSVTVSAKRTRPLSVVAITIFVVALFAAALKAFFLDQPLKLGATLIHADYPYIILAQDETGNTLWQKDLGARVIKVEAMDLDQNGSTEVIASIGKWNYSDWGERSGWLLVWDEEGNLLSEQNLWKPSIYPEEEPSVLVEDFQIVDLDKDGKLDIVLMIRGQEWYPSRIAVVHYEDNAFKEMNTYWHPGFVRSMVIEDVDGDGSSEIVCAAVNNDLKRVPTFQVGANVHSLFMLQGRSISGQAPPYLGRAEKGSQIWYRYITPDCRSDVSRITGLSVTRNNEKPILVELDNTCFIYFNYEGEVIERFYGDSCKWEAELHLISNEKTW
jgi:hypothetical protein